MNPNIIVPDAFKMNAYRVLRVPVSASAAEIRRAAANTGDVRSGDTHIRAAVGRLATPQQRLTDRLFWFCDLDPSGHDAALRDLFHAMQGGLNEAGLATWVRALRAWHTVTRDDDYWFLSLIHEDQGGFEPSATSQDVDGLRADAVRIAAEPLILAAHAALAADEPETVERILTALSELTDTGPWATAAIDEIAAPCPV